MENNAAKNDSPVIEKLEHALEVIANQEATIENILNHYSYQLLDNTEALVDAACEKFPEQKQTVSLLAENLIKRPFRRQIGRLKGIKRLLNEVQKELEAIKNCLQHPTT